MRLGNRIAAGAAAAALTVLSATSAGADVVSNDLDTSVDAVHEQMNLTYPGSAGSTKLYVIVEGIPGGGPPGEHPGCDINGSNKITLTPVLSVPGVATVSLSNGGVIDDCTDTVRATVTPVGLGSTEVSFSGVSKTPNDPNLSISYVAATFDVNVAQGTSDGGGGSRCEADRAAPAWASALLKGNGLRAKVAGKPNFISSVARHMETGATFHSWGKAVHPYYENAVWDYMRTQLGLSLPKGPAEVKKPGWNCTALPTS